MNLAVRTFNFVTVYKNFLLSPDQKHVFCYVPKVACTNWKCLFRQANGADDWLDSRICHDRHGSGLTYLDGSDPSDFARLCKANSRTVMVRDPFTRILSAYLDKIRRRIDGGVIKEIGRQSDNHWSKVANEISFFLPNWLDGCDEKNMFKGFLKWLAHSEHAFTRDEHWAPQVVISACETVNFDIVAKFEELPESANEILEALNFSQSFPTQKAVKFPKIDAASKIRQYYDEESEALVTELYSEDFKTFGYRKHL